MKLRFSALQAHIAIALIAAIQACTERTPSSSASMDNPIPVCDLLRDPAAFDGQEVRIRTALEYGVEYIRLYDDACRDALLFVGSWAPEVDIWGCDSGYPNETYGCPLNSDLGVRVTLMGIFHKPSATGADAASLLDVQSMTEVSINPALASN